VGSTAHGFYLEALACRTLSALHGGFPCVWSACIRLAGVASVLLLGYIGSCLPANALSRWLRNTLLPCRQGRPMTQADRSTTTHEAPQCSLCGETFHSQRELDEHNREEHSQDRANEERHTGRGSQQSIRQSRATETEEAPQEGRGRSQEQGRSSSTRIEEADRQVHRKRAAA
jgi:hypothetical protein